MIKCHIKTFFLTLFLIAGYGASFLPLLLVQPHLQFDQFLLATLAWLLIVLISLPFFLRHLIRKAWFFKSSNNSISLEHLKTKLMEINEFNSPVIVQKKRKKLLASWRYSEPEWSERMAIEGIKKCYFVKLIFNQNTRTVSMIDRVKYVNFDLSPIKVKTSWMARPRFYCTVQVGSDNDIQIFKEKNAEQYRFKPQEIKSPLFNAFINSGWNVRFDLF